MPIPKGYRQIAATLRARIAAGEYKPGERLPTYNELAEEFSVSVSTVQKAVLILQQAGVIVGAQGRGLYVAEKESP